MSRNWVTDPASFRDPSGFVFSHDGRIYRQVNAGYEHAYVRLRESGLFEELTRAGLLVASEEVPLRLEHAPPAFAVLAPQQIPFISYPFEWCFSQLKAAALLTLEMQRRALERGLVLRDASAYNVQFIGTQPVFIDTLSFGVLSPDVPWVAYRQFCQHFLAPLALIASVDPSLGQLSRVHLDGIPLEVARRLLPARLRWRPGVMMHIAMHARSAAAAGDQTRATPSPARGGRMGKTALLALTDSLRRTVEGIQWDPPATLWSTYRDHANYSAGGNDHKRQLVADALQRICGGRSNAMVWDLGANDGVYSRLAANAGARVISFDLDPVVVEHHTRACLKNPSPAILPLVQDLTNPTPAFGWRHAERPSLLDRGPADVALALALVHHLVISGGVPLTEVVRFFRAACRHLVIEFVPKSDSQVARMLALREDTFPDYSQDGFERAFRSTFSVVAATRLADSERTLYVLERRDS